MSPDSIKHEIGQFYNEVGWQMEADGVYQNARYEDLRPVSADYIHQCHMRVKRHLAPTGKYLLDGVRVRCSTMNISVIQKGTNTGSAWTSRW